MDEKKEKIVLSVYVSPRCKAKLECLQTLYSYAGAKFSLSKIVEDSIGYLYAGAYLCQNNKVWEGFFAIGKLLEGEVANKGVDEVIKIAKKNKEVAKAILNVPLDLKKEIKKKIKIKSSQRGHKQTNKGVKSTLDYKMIFAGPS